MLGEGGVVAAIGWPQPAVTIASSAGRGQQELGG